jgi:DNA-binding NarL/FixJ family response regulator
VTEVVICDDEELVREGFRLILQAQPDIEVVGEAANGRGAIEQVALRRPDVVLMDIRMPGIDGIEATRRLLARQEAPQVLILTTFDLDEYVYRALSAGASGFLLKNAPPAELADAVRTVARGDALLAPEVVRRLVERFVSQPPPTEGAPAELSTLTERELEVLRLIAQGCSNSEIADELVLSGATVKTHINRIFGKLGLRERAQAVVLAYESGLVRPGERSVSPGSQGSGGSRTFEDG